jgi:LysR family glycine cleavage system transcriptional activator
MKRGQLPLTALRSFEAAGRHESFTRAAQELFVSQAAVSRQVRELETWLGHALFERRHRQVTVTERGRLLLDQLTCSFDNIDRVLDDLRAGPSESVLLISVEPSVAFWLVPHLDRFRRLHPDIDVAVDPDPRPTEFRTSKAQLAIRWSETTTSWPRVQAQHLSDIVMAPVLSPALLASGPGLKEPADLRRYTLLHEDDRTGWNRWLRKARVSKLGLDRGPLFADTVLAMQAAIRGHGVALANMILAQEDLQSGNLVRPFDIDVPCGAYWLVAPDFGNLTKPARAFADWIRSEFPDEGMGTNSTH